MATLIVLLLILMLSGIVFTFAPDFSMPVLNKRERAIRKRERRIELNAAAAESNMNTAKIHHGQAIIAKRRYRESLGATWIREWRAVDPFVPGTNKPLTRDEDYAHTEWRKRNRPIEPRRQKLIASTPYDDIYSIEDASGVIVRYVKYDK